LDSSFPLSTLLSQTLVAFTIEVDNEAEHRIPHRTAKSGPSDGSRDAPWLVSLAMYLNCLKHLPAEGLAVEELYRQAKTRTNLPGMLRWRYVDVDSKAFEGKDFVRPTPRGLSAKAAWETVLEEMEPRWRDRFGSGLISALRDALTGVVAQLRLDLPDCLPILGYGLSNKHKFGQRDPDVPLPYCSLPTLLSKAPLAYTIGYEAHAQVSLAIGSNVLRVCGKDGVKLRDLPTLSGTSKESVAMAVGFLERREFLVREPLEPRGHLVRLTESGLEARNEYLRRTAAAEKEWEVRFGSKLYRDLRAALEALVGDGTPENSPLFECLVPYPDNWRAKVPRPITLPHYPLVLHRGGYPDGS